MIKFPDFQWILIKTSFFFHHFMVEFMVRIFKNTSNIQLLGEYKWKKLKISYTIIVILFLV